MILFLYGQYQMLKIVSLRLSLEHFCRLQWWIEPCPDKCWTLPKPWSINFPSPRCSESFVWQLPADEATGLSDWGGGWLKGWFVGLLWSDLLLSEAAAAAAAICCCSFWVSASWYMFIMWAACTWTMRSQAEAKGLLQDTQWSHRFLGWGLPGGLPPCPGVPLDGSLLSGSSAVALDPEFEFEWFVFDDDEVFAVAATSDDDVVEDDESREEEVEEEEAAKSSGVEASQSHSSSLSKSHLQVNLSLQ